MVWTPHWSSGEWNVAANNSDDIHGGGRDLIGHPVEVSQPPIALYGVSTGGWSAGRLLPGLNGPSQRVDSCPVGCVFV